MKRLYIVDADSGFIQYFENLIFTQTSEYKMLGHNLKANDFLVKIKDRPELLGKIDLLFINPKLNDLNGLELVKKIKGYRQDINICIIINENIKTYYENDIAELGIHHVLVYPNSDEFYLESVRKIFEDIENGTKKIETGSTGHSFQSPKVSEQEVFSEFNSQDFLNKFDFDSLSDDFFKNKENETTEKPKVENKGQDNLFNYDNFKSNDNFKAENAFKNDVESTSTTKDTFESETPKMQGDFVHKNASGSFDYSNFGQESQQKSFITPNFGFDSEKETKPFGFEDDSFDNNVYTNQNSNQSNINSYESFDEESNFNPYRTFNQESSTSSYEMFNKPSGQTEYNLFDTESNDTDYTGFALNSASEDKLKNYFESSDNQSNNLGGMESMGGNPLDLSVFGVQTKKDNSINNNGLINNNYFSGAEQNNSSSPFDNKFEPKNSDFGNTSPSNEALYQNPFIEGMDNFEMPYESNINNLNKTHLQDINRPDIDGIDSFENYNDNRNPYGMNGSAINNVTQNNMYENQAQGYNHGGYNGFGHDNGNMPMSSFDNYEHQNNNTVVSSPNAYENPYDEYTVAQGYNEKNKVNINSFKESFDSFNKNYSENQSKGNQNMEDKNSFIPNNTQPSGFNNNTLNNNPFVDLNTKKEDVNPSYNFGQEQGYANDRRKSNYFKNSNQPYQSENLNSFGTTQPQFKGMQSQNGFDDSLTQNGGDTNLNNNIASTNNKHKHFGGFDFSKPPVQEEATQSRNTLNIGTNSLKSQFASGMEQDELMAMNRNMSNNKSVIENMYNNSGVDSLNYSPTANNNLRQAPIVHERTSNNAYREVPNFAKQVVAFYSTKGGIGKTSLAINSTIQLAKYSKKKICLIDFDVTNANVHTHLGILDSTYDLSVVSNFDAEIDSFSLSRIVTPYRVKDKNGDTVEFDVIVGFKEMKMAQRFNEKEVFKILTILEEMYDIVVVDTHPVYTDLAVSTILKKATKIVFVTEQEMTALNGAKDFILTSKKYGIPAEKLFMVLNRYKSQTSIFTKNRIEKGLNKAILATVPSDMDTLRDAVNTNNPVSIANPDSELARAYIDVAKIIEPTMVVPDEPKGFFSKFKR